ncbi:MAG: hypothetical protein WDO69_15525 [Pseudomonadota bacterium]
MGLLLAIPALAAPFALFAFSQPGNGVNQYYRELHAYDADQETTPTTAPSSVSEAAAASTRQAEGRTGTDSATANDVVLPLDTIVAGPPTRPAL